jgi:hypothetical protein
MARLTTKGGVMMGRMVSSAQGLLGREGRAGDHKREGEAEQRRAGAGGDCQRQRVPGDAAARPAGDAAQSPDARVDEPVEEDLRGQAAVGRLDGAGQDAGDGKEDEGRDQGDDQCDRADDEAVAIDSTTGGDALREQHEKGEEGERRSGAHAELPNLERPEPGVQELEAPAAMDDEEALGQNVEGSGHAAGDQQVGRGRRVLPTAEQQQGGEERQGERQEPPAAVQQRLLQAGCRGLPVPGEEPPRIEEAARLRVPRDQGEARPADGEPKAERTRTFFSSTSGGAGRLSWAGRRPRCPSARAAGCASRTSRRS